ILQTVVTGTAPLPSNGKLTADAHFMITVGTPDAANPAVSVTVTAASTQSNTTIGDLVGEINTAINNALNGKGMVITGHNSASDITLTNSDGDEISITADASDPALTQLFLPTTPGFGLRGVIAALPADISNTALINLAQELTTAATTSTTAAQLAAAVVA